MDKDPFHSHQEGALKAYSLELVICRRDCFSHTRDALWTRHQSCPPPAPPLLTAGVLRVLRVPSPDQTRPGRRPPPTPWPTVRSRPQWGGVGRGIASTYPSSTNVGCSCTALLAPLPRRLRPCRLARLTAPPRSARFTPPPSRPLQSCCHTSSHTHITLAPCAPACLARLMRLSQCSARLGPPCLAGVAVS